MATKGVPLPSWEKFEDLAEFDFDAACAKRYELKKLISQAEAEIKQLDETIGAALTAVGVKSVEWKGRQVTQADGRSASRIIPAKLLENGVTAEQIEASTEPGKPYTYIQIKDMKVKE